MTPTELNEYIKHYLEKDKTHTAIMLTGEWGAGKTYYIEHELIPFLQKDKKSRCVVISLYGMESISDISKSVYMELRIKALKKNSERFEAGKLIAKTIVKNVVGVLGIDADISERDLQKLYNSVDLSGKLLIFEDLERSDINIVKLMGYVNNLVERDGVKVLLVANEREISISESVHQYLKIKEKTIGDTVCFENEYYKSVKNIITTFENEKLQLLINEDVIKQLALMVRGECHQNFRTFIFATQKMVDILDKIEEKFEEDFLICIYFGILHFSARIKVEEFPKWKGTEFLSTELGTNKYPLFKFCYDYIKWQNLELKKIGEAKEAYDKMKLYDKNAERNDIDLQTIFYCYDRTESEVRGALKSIEERLKQQNSIGFYCYGRLAASLVKLGHLLQFDYTKCKERMIKNIKGKGESIDSEILFIPIYDFEEEEKSEYDDFVKQLSESMNCQNRKTDFSYNPYDIKNLDDYVLMHGSQISRKHQFISEYKADLIVEMLFHASSKQIDDFRGILFSVYRYATKTDFIEADLKTMEELLTLIEERIESHSYDIDKIQLKQLNWLCDNLKTFISQMK